MTEESPDQLTERLALAMSKAQMRRIDEWRRAQQDIPSRSQAMRQLIDAAIEQERRVV